MTLRIRYENTYQTLELNEKDTAALWVSLDIEGEYSADKKCEQKIQQTFDEKYNCPEYNSWHKFDRHHGNTKAEQYEDDGTGGEEEVGGTWCEPTMEEVADPRIFCQDQIAFEQKCEYEDVCDWVRKTLAKKPQWAEAFIAVRLNDVSVNDYAAQIGVSDASVVSHWLERAANKLRENYPNRQI